MTKVFTEEWFKENQLMLLTLINSDVGKEFGEIFGVRKPIIKLSPNSIHWVNEDFTFGADFYVRNRIAEKLYILFNELWLKYHLLDYVLKTYNKKLNFGFDTLEVSPDPHVETNTVDGRTYTVATSQTWATKRAAYGGGAIDNETEGNLVGLQASTSSNQYAALVRGHFLFQTDTLTAAASISEAVFSFYLVSLATNLICDSDLHLCSTNPTSNTAIVAGDHIKVGDTSFGSKTTVSATVGAVNTITLNASGISAISKTGITKLGTRLGCDINNIEPTWSSAALTRWRGYFAESGTPPKLTVTYTIGSNIGML